jgi:hypothetical protein
MREERVESTPEESAEEEFSVRGLDPSKAAADLELRLTAEKIDSYEVWAAMKGNAHFNDAGQPLKETDGQFVLIEDAVLLGYPVNIWINYQPHSLPTEEIVQNKKAMREHQKSCLRDGWGKLFVMLSLDLDEDGEVPGRCAAAISVMDLMRHQTWGHLEEKVQYCGYLEF